LNYGRVKGRVYTAAKPPPQHFFLITNLANRTNFVFVFLATRFPPFLHSRDSRNSRSNPLQFLDHEFHESHEFHYTGLSCQNDPLPFKFFWVAEINQNPKFHSCGP